ncbi:MAG: helix-turn-helix transcriptional regulator [Chloroflexi bacterium]|nr:helix-turn-helix transcriptional regulator [Chloroflexota bacterium]
MEPHRVGLAFRAVRIRKGLRQQDVAAASGVSRSTVSRIERGEMEGVPIGALLTVASALGISADLRLRWAGSELDRMLNARHAALHESVARSFRDLSDWVIAPEVSFSVYGERGVIDLLAWHGPTRSLIVIELKTALVDVNDLMGSVDRKRRLAPRVGRERGWDPASVSVWVILAGGRTNRRKVAAHSATLRAAFPDDGRSVRPWLRAPVRAISCLSLWTDAHGAGAKRGLATVHRVRRRASRVA